MKRLTPRIIAYGSGSLGIACDNFPRFVVHSRCWQEFSKITPYRRSLDRAYYSGAEKEQLRGILCAHCKKAI